MKFSSRINVVKLLNFVLIVPISLIILLFLIAPNPYLAAGSDFISYFTGASIIKDNKTHLIYDITTQEEYFENIIYPYKGEVFNRYISPPFVAIMFLPFTFINYFTAYKLFFIANLGLFSIFLYILSKVFTRLEEKYKFFYIISFYFIPAATTLFMGQTSFLLAIIFLLIYINLAKNRSKEAGMLSAALLVKPQFIIAIPLVLLLVKKKKQFLLWFLGVTFFLFLISLLIAGPKALSDYLPSLLSTENPQFGNRAHQMFSFHAATTYFFFNSNLSNIYSLIVNLVVYLSSLYLFAKRIIKMRLKTAFILVLFLTLTFSIHVLSHDLTLLLLPIFIIINDTLKPGKTNGVLLAFALLLFVLPSTVSLGNSIYGGLMLFVLSAYVLFRPEILEERFLRNENSKT